jgi:hypothetical protein
VYFSGDFTVTAWINLKTSRSWARIFDFGNGQIDNVFLGMYGTSSQLVGKIYKGSSQSQILTSSIVINLNEWYFISFVLSDTTGFIYVNGNQAVNGTLNVPNNVTRTTNYIGKSNWATDSNIYADAIYDEFKINKVALSSSDIMNEYQISSNNGKQSF